MTPERWARVKATYHAALERDPGERVAFLKEACSDDPELLNQVESLLAEPTGDSFLERPAWQPTESGEVESTAGEPAGALGRCHPFLWVVWLVTAALTAAFGYAAWKMPRDVPAFGWSETRRGHLWLVASVDPSGLATAKLQPGDLVLSVNGDAGVARAGTAAYRRVLGIGESYRIQVRRGSEVFDYFLETARGRPNVARALLGYSLGLGWCVVGVFIGFAKPQDPAARLAFAAVALTGFVFLQVSSLPALWALQPLHGVLGYHFFYRFPAGVRRLFRSRHADLRPGWKPPDPHPSGRADRRRKVPAGTIDRPRRDGRGLRSARPAVGAQGGGQDHARRRLRA